MRTFILLFFVHSGNKIANRTMIYLPYGPEKIRNCTISEADEPKEEIDRNRGFNSYPRDTLDRSHKQRVIKSGQKKSL